MFADSFPVPSSIDLWVIAPIVIVALTGLIAMTIELFNPKKPNEPIIAVSVVGLVAALATLLPQFQMGPGETLVGMVIRDQFSLVCQLLVVVGSLMTILFSEGYLRSRRIPYAEFYPLVLWSTTGGMIMSASHNLLAIFMGLEMLSISLYVLAGMCRSDVKSEESAIKYFLLGAFSTGFLLYGIAMFYGATGSLQVNTLAQSMRAGPAAQMLLLFSFALMTVGLGFKAAFVPFHQWTPDVYQGAPTNVTAFMAVVSKIASLAALFRVMVAASPMSDLWIPALSVIAMMTMIVGNVVALMQKDVKRILGYSSIANAGYILVGMLAYVKNPSVESEGALLYYLLGYGLVTLGAFAIVSLFGKGSRETTRLEDLRGLWKRAPFAAITLLILMVSLIGIPPMAGFFGKLFIFQMALGADLTMLAITLAATSIVSCAYYLQIAWSAFVSDPTDETPLAVPMGVRTVAAICAAGVILLGVLFNPVQKFLTNTDGLVVEKSVPQVVQR